MRLIIKVLVLAFLFFITGCGKSRIIHFYSLDRSQCITVIDEGGYRYVIDGKHRSVPESEFVKLDMSNIDPVGTGVHICWGNEKYEWDVVVDKSKIVESKLDTSKFNFKTSLPTDERGIPTEIKFRDEGCAIFSFYLMRLSPDKGAIVEIE